MKQRIKKSTKRKIKIERNRVITFFFMWEKYELNVRENNIFIVKGRQKNWGSVTEKLESSGKIER